MITKVLKQEMEELGIQGITLITQNKNCGEVVIDNGNLKYNKGVMYSIVNDSAAFSFAYAVLSENKSRIENFKKSAGKDFGTPLFYTDFDKNEYNHIETKYIWKSDFVDSGTRYDGEKVYGNINELRKFLSFANNHCRYCRSGYSYTNEEVNELLATGRTFKGLFENFDSFSEYYHNAIVD